jgi:hypothetical protein
MEFSKVHSDVLILKGLKSGLATISVRLNEPGYETLPLSRVKLTITEPFAIIPTNTVYLLPTTRFEFKLAKVIFKERELIYHPI